MSTTQRALNTQELEQRVKDMYREVAEEPFNEFHFETGRHVTATRLPEGVTCDAALWAACIGGAMQGDDYREAIEAAGFELDDLRENSQYRFVSERAANATQKYGVKSVSLLAIKN